MNLKKIPGILGSVLRWKTKLLLDKGWGALSDDGKLVGFSCQSFEIRMLFSYNLQYEGLCHVGIVVCCFYRSIDSLLLGVSFSFLR